MSLESALAEYRRAEGRLFRIVVDTYPKGSVVRERESHLVARVVGYGSRADEVRVKYPDGRVVTLSIWRIVIDPLPAGQPRDGKDGG